MPSILIDPSTNGRRLYRKVSLEQRTGGRDEKWLQKLLFDQPELVLLDEIDFGAGDFVPLTREFSLLHYGKTVFLDILGVSRSGRLVLVECKLWRNPQARREVIAQILEYAALLRGQTFGDLSAQLARKLGTLSANPLFELARQKWPDLDEARFVDAVTHSLATGDFYLIVAGDGMRSELRKIADHLNSSQLRAARFAMLEVGVWQGDGGETLVVPHVPVATEIIQHRVYLDRNQALMIVESDENTAAGSVGSPATEPTVTSPGGAQRADNRAFWQDYIDGVTFRHPEQPKPTHGGNNWVKIALPGPVAYLNAYRGKHGSMPVLGMQLKFDSDEKIAFFHYLDAEADALRRESGLDLVFERRSNGGLIYVIRALEEFDDEQAQLAWLYESSDDLVTAIRPLISRWMEEQKA